MSEWKTLKEHLDGRTLPLEVTTKFGFKFNIYYRCATGKCYGLEEECGFHRSFHENSKGWKLVDEKDRTAKWKEEA